MQKATKNDYSPIFAWLGLIFLLPALILITGGFLFSWLHLPWIVRLLNPTYFIFQPWTMMSGIVMSILLNIKFILKPLELRKFNLYIFLGSCVLLGLMIIYLAAQNLSVFSFIF